MRLLGQRTVVVLGILVFAVAAGWVALRGKKPGRASSLTQEVRHLWGYGVYTRSEFQQWLGNWARRFVSSKPGRSEASLVLGGATMSWGWSNPTSAWFQFGDLLKGTNLSYWELALPDAPSIEDALNELPSLTFKGPDSNYWAARLGAWDTQFQPRTVGLGAIRLATNRIFFARHYQTQDVVHLVQFHSMTAGRFGDVVVRFRNTTVNLSASEARPR